MTHDILRRRLMRAIDALPEERIYQVLDYIEFLEGKYGNDEAPPASRLQQIAEGIEDRLRKRSVSPGALREAFQFISAADRVLSGVSEAGKRVLSDIGQVVDERDDPSSPTRKEGGGSTADRNAESET
ncbi:MAG: hypothetical protein J4G12_04430 [Gemmatimonadetes bacterium]|nr:hypothetical protein [Gemmatimonadota bacterium]